METDEQLVELVVEPAKIRHRRKQLINFLLGQYGSRGMDYTISVWGKCSASEAGSASLKASTMSLCARLGIARPRCLKYTELTMPDPLIMTYIAEPGVRRDIFVSRKALYDSATAMHNERYQQARGVIATATHSGRVLYSFCHIICLRHTRDEPYEYVVFEMPSEAAGFGTTVNFAVTRELDCYLHAALNEKRRRPKKLLIANPEISRSTACAMCGITDSIIRRMGPTGEANLCNKCGIKYARTHPVSIALSPAPLPIGYPVAYSPTPSPCQEESDTAWSYDVESLPLPLDPTLLEVCSPSSSTNPDGACSPRNGSPPLEKFNFNELVVVSAGDDHMAAAFEDFAPFV